MRAKLAVMSFVAVCAWLVVFAPAASAAVVMVPSDGDAWTESVSFSGGNWAAYNWPPPQPEGSATVEASSTAKVGTKSIRLNSVGNSQIQVGFSPPVDISGCDTLKVWFKTSGDWPESVESFRIFDSSITNERTATTPNVYIYQPSTGHDWYEIVIPRSTWTVLPGFDDKVALIQFGANNRLPPGTLYMDGFRFERPATLEERVNELESRVGGLELGLTGLEEVLTGRIDALEDGMDDVVGDVAALDEAIDKHIEDFLNHVHDKGSGGRMTGGPVIRQ